MNVTSCLLFAAEVTPLTPAAQVIGGGIGVCLVLAGMILIVRKVRQLQRLTDPETRPKQPPLDSPWRFLSAVLMVILGGLMIAGVIVDPRIQGRAFVYIWTAAIAFVLLLMLVALLDLMVVRRKAYFERFRLREKHKAELREDLALISKVAATANIYSTDLISRLLRDESVGVVPVR